MRHTLAWLAVGVVGAALAVAALWPALGTVAAAATAMTSASAADTAKALPPEAVAAADLPLKVYTDKVTKSDDEWKKILTPDQFSVLREAGTERPGSGALLNEHDKGVFRCAACGQLLFASSTKFESGTGWPSFWKPFAKESVIEKTDSTLGMVRTEILCSRCGSHLGHVFTDGPPPTHLRYCMNSLALKFQATK